MDADSHYILFGFEFCILIEIKIVNYASESDDIPKIFPVSLRITLPLCNGAIQSN